MQLMPQDMTLANAIAEMAMTDVVNAAASRWSEPWRAYHDDLHMAELKDHLLAAERDGVKITDGAAAFAWVIWHDAIYDPMAAKGRNETLSAQLCARQFATIGHPQSVTHACEAILSTIGHEPPAREASPDAALLLDCDLAILGAAPERFAQYNAQIREEYAHVPIDSYTQHRRVVLSRFLERDRLYITDWAHARWDAAARINLATAIAI